MKNKQLWIIDDHPNESTLNRLDLVAIPPQQCVDIRPFCGTGWPSEFGKMLERGIEFSEHDFFLLDVYMPIFPQIKPIRYWGKSDISEKYSGFALAQWLIQDHHIAINRIRLCSAHKDVKSKTKEFEFEGILECWEGWHRIDKVAVRKWMGISEQQAPIQES